MHPTEFLFVTGHYRFGEGGLGYLYIRLYYETNEPLTLTDIARFGNLINRSLRHIASNRRWKPSSDIPY